MKRTVVSLVLGLAGVVLFAYGLGQTLKIGTCASGNSPYLIAHQCPSGAATKSALLGAGIVLAAIAILVGVGWARLLVWSALFLAGGIAALLSALSGNVSSGGKLAGIIIGAIFIPMGGLPMLWLAANGLSSLRSRRELARSKQADATVTRVEELQRFGLNQARIRITYAVQPPDEASFEVSRETNVLLSHEPRAGERVRVRYDPSNHARFELVSAASAGDALLAEIARG